MGEVVVPEQSYDDGDSCFEKDNNSSHSTDTEEFLDLADLNEFMDCNTVPAWQSDKFKIIDRLIESSCDADSFRIVCFSRGGLLNGTKSFFKLQSLQSFNL